MTSSHLNIVPTALHPLNSDISINAAIILCSLTKMITYRQCFVYSDLHYAVYVIVWSELNNIIFIHFWFTMVLNCFADLR